MIRTWLDPNVWGSETVGEQSGWARQTKARVYEAVDYLNRAGGVNYVETIELALNGGAYATADIDLTGAAPLPQVGRMEITVNPAE
jgi:ribosomal protein L1